MRGSLLRQAIPWRGHVRFVGIRNPLAAVLGWYCHEQLIRAISCEPPRRRIFRYEGSAAVEETDTLDENVIES